MIKLFNYHIISIFWRATFIYALGFLFLLSSDAIAQKLQNASSLSSAEKKYRQYCLKKEECVLYGDIRSAFPGVSTNDPDLKSKIEKCEKQLTETGKELSVLLKKEKKVVPLDMCK